MRFLLFLCLALHVEASEVSQLLFSGNCITCHKENKTESAPSIAKVKEVYKNAFAKKEVFISYMSKWVSNPNEDRSLMHNAIKKHGLMPHLGFDEDVLKEISAYIYETNFNKK